MKGSAKSLFGCTERWGHAEMGGGPASYIPAHTSSALAASFRT